MTMTIVLSLKLLATVCVIMDKSQLTHKPSSCSGSLFKDSIDLACNFDLSDEAALIKLLK